MTRDTALKLNENKKISSRFYAGIAKIDAYHYKYNIQMSAWNGFMDYSFSEKTFSREDDGNLSRQMFIREGGLKHYTDITSDNFLTSLSLDYNLLKMLHIYAEAGTDGTDFAYGSGLKINLSGIGVYIPVFTENGLFNGGKYHEGIRLQLNANLQVSGFGF